MSACRPTTVAALISAAIVSGTSLSEARACKLASWPATGVELVSRAEWILRVRVQGYASPLKEGQRPGTIRFEVLEMLKGAPPTASVEVCCGQLEEYLGANDGPVPYTMVRPGGRSGDCFAGDYKVGLEYLLFLKRAGEQWTTAWAPLAAVNEEASPAWVEWVRAAIRDPGLESKVEAERLLRRHHRVRPRQVS